MDVTKKKSIKVNFIYNILLKILNLLFPLITFPYVARILSPEGIGKVDFSLSFVQYFILFALAGIPTYAVKQCARHREDKEKLTKTVQEILMINLFFVLISYILFIIIIFNIDKLESYRYLLLIMSINILSTSLGIEWFYQAVEEFRYIAIRNLIVKLLSLICVVVFVKEESDYILYGVIMVISISLGYIYNLVYLNKYIRIFKRYSNYNLKRHIKSIIILFAMSISVSIYVNLDKVMLGLISGDTAVGLYTAADRLVKVILGIVTSLGIVLLPRISYYVELNAREEIDKLISKSIDFILLISVPAFIGIILMAEPIILLFAGEDYTEAISTMRIMSPIILVIGISNLIGLIVFVSHGKEKMTLISTIIGAIVNFTLNFIFIPKLAQNGAALSSLIAESVVTIVQLYFAYKIVRINIKNKHLISYLTGGIVIVLVCRFLNTLQENIIIITVISIITSVLSYFFVLTFFRNDLIFEFKQIINAKFKK